MKVESKHFFDDTMMKCLPSYVYPCHAEHRKCCIFRFHWKMCQDCLHLVLVLCVRNDTVCKCVWRVWCSF